jgi:hypothetical protein
MDADEVNRLIKTCVELAIKPLQDKITELEKKVAQLDFNCTASNDGKNNYFLFFLICSKKVQNPMK